jgi:hypothetical protein
LGGTQLSATASVPGTFTYSPAAGTVLPAGSQTLTVTFAPTDTQHYTTATASVTLIVNPAAPTITWATPAAIIYGMPLGTMQLNATASVAGTFTYSPAANTVLPVGNQTLSTTFTPTDATDYSSATASVVLPVVNPAPTISGLSPAYAQAGESALTLTVNGAGFVPASTVYWASNALTTTYVSSTQLTAQVPASAIASAGTASVSVQTGTPGGGSSTPLLFQIDSASSQGGASPTFTTTSVTVQAGSSANYAVTLPSSVTSATISCLNLPTGVSCSYANGAVTIATSSTTPAGTYAITVVFTETLTGQAAFIVPFLLLPLAFRQGKSKAAKTVLYSGAALILLVSALAMNGCGGAGSGTTTTPPQTHQATSSGSVNLTVSGISQ